MATWLFEHAVEHGESQGLTCQRVLGGGEAQRELLRRQVLPRRLLRLRHQRRRLHAARRRNQRRLEVRNERIELRRLLAAGAAVRQARRQLVRHADAHAQVSGAARQQHRVAERRKAGEAAAGRHAAECRRAREAAGS